MKKTAWDQRICVSVATITLAMLFVARPVSPAIKNIAVVMTAGTTIEDVQLSELIKLCKGVQKTWIEGKSFTLVMTDPASPDMHAAIQKLFNMPPADLKAARPKINETRTVIKVVDSDADLLRTV
jgi:hypothetical protein